MIFIKGNVKGKFLGRREILIFFKVRNLWKTIERINAIDIGNCTFSLSVKSGYDVIINTVDYILGYLNFGLKNTSNTIFQTCCLRTVKEYIFWKDF